MRARWTAAALLCLGRPESRSSISLRAAIGMRLSIWGLPWCTDVHYLGGVAYATHAPRLECAIGMTQVSLCRLSSRFRLSVRSHGLGRSPATPDQPRSGHAGATTATPVAYTAVVCPATQAHRTSPPRGGRRRRPRLAARPSRVTVPAHPQRRRRRPGRRRRCSPPPCLRVAPSSAPSSCASAAPPLYGRDLWLHVTIRMGSPT